MLNTEFGFISTLLDFSAGTTLANGIGKEWLITSDQDNGITLYLSGVPNRPNLFGIGKPQPSSSTTPFWLLQVDHKYGSSEFRVDAIPGATIAIPARSVRLYAAIESGPIFTPTIALGKLPILVDSTLGHATWACDFGFTAVEGCAPRGAAEGQQGAYTFLRTFNLAAGGAANTGIIALPNMARFVFWDNDAIAINGSQRNEFISHDGTTVIHQQLGQVTNIVPGQAGFTRITNTNAVTAMNVSAVALLGL